MFMFLSYWHVSFVSVVQEYLYLSESFKAGFIVVDHRSIYMLRFVIGNSPCTVPKIFLKHFKSLLSKGIFQ